MSGWLTNGLPNFTQFAGLEQFPFDVQTSGGQAPISGVP